MAENPLVDVITIAGGAVAWSPKKQITVAPSTPEAEYIAATHWYVAKQILVWYFIDLYSRN